MHEFPLALCTVMLLELVVPAAQPPEDPAVLKRVVHELLGKALRGLPETSRMAIESAGSAVVCFTCDPEESLHSALLLRELLSRRYGNLMSARIALHLGPVRVTADRNDQVAVSGDGIRQAAQVRDHAQPNEVLVSHAYHELLTRLNPETAELFQYHGLTEQRPLEVYSVIPSPAGSGAEGAASFVMTRPGPLPPASLLDAEAVHDTEAELAGYIGPLAHVLVRKAAGRAGSLRELREILATAIHNPQTREFFLEGTLGQPGPATLHGNDAPQPSRPGPLAGSPASPRTDSTRQIDIAPAELAIIGHTLQRFIGPMTQPLMRREIDLCRDFQDFVGAIANGIDHPQQREVFLQSLQRALPERRIHAAVQGGV